MTDLSRADEADADLARRRVLCAGTALAASATLLPACALLASGAAEATLGFQPVPASTTDRHAVPAGYVAEPVARWGDAVGIAGSMPAWRADAGNTAAEQALQVGQQIAGLQYLPLDGSRRGLLVLVHNTVDDGALHAGGAQPWTAEKLRKSQAAMGLSVVEIALRTTGWQLVQPAAAARRITAATPLGLSGPAAGHALLKTAADPGGRRVLGLLGAGTVVLTPWGSCLVGEQDWAGLFATADQPTRHERRYGLGSAPASRWMQHEDRFDTVRHPNEPNRCGWVLEFDPRDPVAPAVKRTALGRGAWSALAAAISSDRRAIVYLADGGPFEALARYVSRDTIRDRSGDDSAAARSGLLDGGTLQVARFNADGSGRWLPLVHGVGPLTATNGLADAGEMLIKLRHASELVGATRMDRISAIAVDPASGWVHAALSGNPQRGTPGFPGADAVHPRAGHASGHLLRWRETAEPDRFEWALTLQADGSADAAPGAAGSLRGDTFAMPSSLALDARGRLWIGTAVPGVQAQREGSKSPVTESTDVPGAQTQAQRRERAPAGYHQLLAWNPAGTAPRRFLTVPAHAAIAGAAFTPDGRSLFVAVQHPGAAPGVRSDPLAPQRDSNWPDFNPVGRPRSAVLAVRRIDGGAVGS